MRKRKNMKGRAESKKLRQRIHARKRFLARFGIELTKEVRRELVRQIQGGEARHIRKQSNRVTIYSVQLEGKRIDVVYDNRTHNVVTCLPEPERTSERTFETRIIELPEPRP